MSIEAATIAGAEWLSTSSTTVVFPLGGQGGTTGVAASGDTFDAKTVTIYGVWTVSILDTNTNTFYWITDKDGNDLHRFDHHTGTGESRVKQADFGPHGIELDGGFGIRVGTTGIEVLVAYEAQR